MSNFTNDDKMFYDIKTHRYILTEEAIADEFNIKLTDILDKDGVVDPERAAEIFLSRVSKQLYRYIFTWCTDKEKTTYMLSLPEHRESIYEALCELVYTYITTNTDPSVFFTEDTKDTIKISPVVQSILMNDNLLFRGDIVNLPQDYLDTKNIDW